LSRLPLPLWLTGHRAESFPSCAQTVSCRFAQAKDGPPTFSMTRSRFAVPGSRLLPAINTDGIGEADAVNDFTERR